jgi:hypothetical protein
MQIKVVFFMKLISVVRNVLIILLACLLSMRVSASPDEDGRAWLMINAVGSLPAENWHWYAELQPRWREEASAFDQVIIRPAVYYALTKQSSVWAGYAHVVTDPVGQSSFDEHRIWQQFLHNFQPIGSVSIQSRTRLEQRFIENADDTGHKIRQMIRLTMPSTLNPQLTWVAYDEYFLNLNETDYGARKGFDQNRAFVGINWAFNPSVRLEMGYLNQYINGKNINNMNHVISTMINLFFD